MAKGTYVGIGSKARKAKKLYIGVNGKARKVTKAYIGVNGVAKLCYEGVELISFTIRQLNSSGSTLGSKITCHAVKGMTWGEWVNSSYNTLGYEIVPITTLGNTIGRFGHTTSLYVFILLENIAYNTVDTMKAEETIEAGVELHEKQTIKI